MMPELQAGRDRRISHCVQRFVRRQFDGCTLINADCLDVLSEINGVDAIVTDPPYGQTNEKYDHDVPLEVWAACLNAANPNAALVSFAGSPTYHRIASKIENAGWRVRQMWLWIYNDGMMISAWPKDGYDRLAPACDPICYATKGKNLLTIRREGDAKWFRDRTKPTAKETSYGEGRTNTKKNNTGFGRFPRTVIAECGVPRLEYFVQSRTSPKLRREMVGHPNQKPESLMTWLVDKMPAGATVLDPYMGSGTTGIACIRTGRKFIGIEKDPKHFATAVERIGRELEQGVLLPPNIRS